LNVVVTVLANDERLATPRGHDAYPSWSMGPTFTFQVCQFADVMDFDLLRRPAELACLREKSLHNFTPPAPDRFRLCGMVTHRFHRSGTPPKCATNGFFDGPLSTRTSSTLYVPCGLRWSAVHRRYIFPRLALHFLASAFISDCSITHLRFWS
jgi:hypothetical protein